MNTTFIHYGSDRFLESKFKRVDTIEWANKPHGGFWASGINSNYSWKHWCTDNNFKLDSFNRCFRFKLDSGSRIYTISDLDDYICLQSIFSSNIPVYISDLQLLISERYNHNVTIPENTMKIDWARVSNYYDAVYASISCSVELSYVLHGWDCDSICVMNPNAIIPV